MQRINATSANPCNRVALRLRAGQRPIVAFQFTVHCQVLTRPFCTLMYSDKSPGNEPSLPADTPKVDFQFFNCSHPSEANTLKRRKKVRSYVTKRQHQRKKILTTSKEAQNYQPGAEVEVAPSQRAHAATTSSDRPALSKIARTCQQPGHDDSDTVESPVPSPLLGGHRSSRCVEPADVDPRNWPAYIGRIMASSTRKHNKCTLLTFAG
jgi:hypothetical protein